MRGYLRGLDAVTSKIARQMRKYKTRLLRSHRPRKQDSIRYLEERVYSAEVADAPAADGAAAPQELPVVQTEKYPVKPMFVDEAVLQMEMSARQFIVFLNAKTEKVSVLYRRKKGDSGLIEPHF